MMLLRGATIRRLCSLPVRPYSTAIDVSSAARAAPASVSESEASTEGDMKDVTRYMSVREANKSRTRARVGGRLKAFLGSSEGVWSRGPPRDAYWLLRACGSDMILETTATRMELTETMWEEFEKRAPMPVGMYNTLLQVYLQNGHKFDAVNFLENMENKGVLPNQGTLVGILCCYCEEGDIEGATRILDQMRSLDMEISENIYAALITGHCRRGDMESAEGMLHVMEENGMSPMAASYTALMCGYADRGDMDRVEQLVEVMREKRVFPSVTVFTAVMDRLSAAGHSHLLPRALDLVHNKQLIYNDLYELACKCTMRRDNSGTLLILRCMATLVPRTTNMMLGAIIIRTMTAQDRSLPDVMMMANELHALGFGHHVFEEVLHALHTRQENKDQAMAGALSVLQDMQHHGMTVKEHYYYPNLAYYAEKGDIDSALKCVAQLKGAGLHLRQMAFQYLLRAAKNSVGVASGEGGVADGGDKTDIDCLLDHIKGTPLSLDLVNEFSVYQLDRGHFGQVPPLLTSVTSDPSVTSSDFSLGRILKSIKNGINRSKVVDIEGLVGVYVALLSLPDAPDLTRSIAISTHILIERSRDLAKQFIEELTRNGVNPGDSAYLRLLQSYATSETAKEFYTMARSLQSRGLVLPSSIHKQSLELAADMGDPVRAGQAVSAIKRSGEKLSATAFSRYILANTRSSKIGTALELYERMRSHDLRPSYEALSQLSMELLGWGDIHGAENLRRDLEEMGYHSGLVLRNAFLGAYARQDMTKALQEFEAMKKSERTPPNSFTYNELMVGYSLHGDTESIRSLFDDLQSEGLSLDRGLVSRLFEAYITRDDLDEALGLIGEFPSLPPHASALISAMQLAVSRDRKEEVGRVKAAMREIVGDSVTENALFFAYVKTRQWERAERTMESDGFSLNGRSLIRFMVDIRKRRKVHPTANPTTRDEGFDTLYLLKSKGHHLGDEISVAWLRAYDILRDVEAAKAYRYELEAAGHTPPDEFNRRLATMIEKAGRPIEY